MTAQKNQKDQHKPRERKEQYTFRQATTPQGLTKYSYTVYGFGNGKVTTLRGDAICDVKKPLTHVRISPAGTSVAVVAVDKKNNQARVFSMSETDMEQFKLNIKKYGNPTAVAYTPDSRKLLVASDKGLFMFDSRKFTPVDTIAPLPFSPTTMVFSNNAYYLAMTDGEKTAVYNFEDKKLRKQWPAEPGIKVNSLAFSENNSEFAILTDDGLLSLFDTRTFLPKSTIDGLGEGLGCAFNLDGKYIAVATSPTNIAIINLLEDDDREFLDVEAGGLSDLLFITDSESNPLMAYNAEKAINIKRMTALTPYYGKLISEGVDEMMNEWLKMMPGETMEDYQKRVNDESRMNQMRLFESEIATGFAGDLVSMSNISLGKYDRTNNVLALDFDNMPSIFLPVPEKSVGAFKNTDDLEFRDAKYGILPNDNFELVYARIYNKADGETYIYDNIDRTPLNFMEGDDNVVSLEIIQQQQMEELKLQELRKKVVEEAKSQNVISDHTKITVDSRVVPSFNADGDKILNYQVRFTYEVDPEFSVHEDFAPGKYRAEQSGAASSMLSIVKQAFEGDFAQYVQSGKKLTIKISGTADASPIIRGIPYDGVYGDFEDEPIYQDNQLKGISVSTKSGIKENEQLAFLRAMGVKNFLQNNVSNLGNMNTDYQFHIAVAEGKGAEFRRITTEFTFIDVY